jgi:hypothetical protein
VRSGYGAVLTPVIGTLYTATLRPGQYTIGGNPSNLPSQVCSGLIQEIQCAMNYAVNGTYDPTTSTPFECRLVSEYPELDSSGTSPFGNDTNACKFNRIQIININSDDFALLFCSGPNAKESAACLMGFGRLDYDDVIDTSAVLVGGETLISAGTSIRGDYDYDLLADEKYVILTFAANTDYTFDRIESPSTSLNYKFATIVFDSNYPDVNQDLSGTIENVSGVNYLVGPVTKGTFYREPGMLKPLKGFDFDQKRLDFTPALGKVDSIQIRFSKFSNDPHNPDQTLYDFQGRDHMLVFGLKSTDIKNAMKGL